MRLFLTTLAVTTALAVPAAMAQTTSGSMSATSGSMSGNTNAQTSSPQIQNKLRQDLTQAGFTDVNVVPAELLVHAKNKDGQEVLMLIGPTSLTEFVAPGANTTGNTNTSGATRTMNGQSK